MVQVLTISIQLLINCTMGFDDLINSYDLGKFLGLSKTTIGRWEKRGYLKPIYVGGSSKKFYSKEQVFQSITNPYSRRKKISSKTKFLKNT